MTRCLSGDAFSSRMEPIPIIAGQKHLPSPFWPEGHGTDINLVSFFISS